MAEQLKSSSPVARKNYKCYLCDQVIPKGEKHEQWSGLDDGGKFFSARGHTQCVNLTVTLKWNEDDWECHDPWEFRETLKEQEESANA